MNRQLRIGVIFQDKVIPAWAYRMLAKIDKSSSSEFVLLIEDNNDQTENNVNHFVYDLYKKLDRKYFKTKPDALKKKSLDNLINLEAINIRDIESVEKPTIDIIINLGNNVLNENVSAIAKYGIWRFTFGKNESSTTELNGFWEVIDRKGMIDVILQMQTQNVNKILAISPSLTDNLSVNRCQNSFLWKAASILPRKIEELYRVGEIEFFKRVNEIKHHSSTNDIESISSNAKVLLKLAKFKWMRIQNIIKSFFYFDQWILLYRFEETTIVSKELSKFKKILPPKGKFWADPHVIKKQDTYYIFIEELIYKENKGFISVIEMDNQGNYKDPVKILEQDYHLSFPFIIEDNDDIYMIPESKESKNIQLYKCVNFPYKWELETILMNNVNAVDTVVTKKDNKYWLFTNMIENDGASLYDELYLFSSDSLVSNDWKSHPENPIVSDVKNARMAGKLFEQNGNLHRPSQNCSNHYGYGMQINQITELTENAYTEKTTKSIFPNWDKRISSTHSISHTDNLTVIDAQLKRRK